MRDELPFYEHGIKKKWGATVSNNMGDVENGAPPYDYIQYQVDSLHILHRQQEEEK